MAGPVFISSAGPFPPPELEIGIDDLTPRERSAQSERGRERQDYTAWTAVLNQLFPFQLLLVLGGISCGKMILVGPRPQCSRSFGANRINIPAI